MIYKTLVILTLFLSACSVSVNDENEDVPNGNGNQVIYSYHFEDGCQVTKVFKGSLKEVCDTLADNEANRNCAEHSRESLFKRLCTDEVWPHSTGDLNGAIASKQFQKSINSCSTGTHFIEVTSTGFGFGKASKRSQVIYCDMLQNENLNNGCAKKERQKEFDETCTEND